MTEMKPLLDIVLDANVVLVLAFGLWAMVQTCINRSRLKTDFALQLRLLRTVFVLVMVCPLLSLGFVKTSQLLWPGLPLTVSDVAVAAYLRGEISMSAVQFEGLLSTRDQIITTILSGDVPVITVLVALLGFGALWLAIRTAVTAFHVNRLVTNGYVWRRTRTTDIRLSDTLVVPFATRGLFRRHVVLPSQLLTKPHDLRIVLAHEFEHLRQHDVEWEIVFGLLRPLLYWNPVFLLWQRAFERLRELNCDRSAIRALRVSPKEYALCLLTFCGVQPRSATVRHLNVAFLQTGPRGARKALETRLLALQHTGGTTRSAVFYWAAAGLMAFGIVLAATSLKAPGDWSQDRLMLSTVVNLERLDAINGGN